MSKTKNIEPLNVEGAALIMEDLYISGVYQAYKRTDADLEAIKKSVQDRFHEDEKRREFNDLRVVAKWVPNPTYEVNYAGLNEYLNDLGILVPVARFDYKELKRENPELLELIEPFKEPTEQYIRMTPNKKGKVEIEIADYSDFDEESLIHTWMKVKTRFDQSNNIINQAKLSQLNCPILKEKRKLSSNYGSVSLLDKDPTYNTAAIYHELGPEFLLKYAKINMTKLYSEFVHQGIVTPKEIHSFRRMINLGLKFVIMDLDTESRQFDMLQDRMLQAADKIRSLKEMEQVFKEAV